MGESRRDFEVDAEELEPLLVLAAQCGLAEPGALRGLDLADAFRLMKRLAQASGEETFALSARPMLAGTAEFVFSRAQGCATVGEAMRAIATAYNLLHGDAYNRVERISAKLRYAIDDEAYPYTRPRDAALQFSLECATIFLHAALCEMAGRDLTPAVRRVDTRRPLDGADRKGALAFWTAPVRGGSAIYAVTYDAAVGAWPLEPGDRHAPPDLAVHNRILALIEASRAAPAPPTALADRVRQALADGVIEQDAVARRLGVSPATLRRRLSEEGESFRDLRQAVMSAYARERLKQTADVASVSEELGFSDPRAFTRAFKGWTGTTPTAWRRAP
jgi:AraC-like DNA-binding protein